MSSCLKVGDFMPCYHPLKGFPVGKTNNGKIQFKIVPGRVDHLEYRNGNCLLVDIPDGSAFSERIIRDFVWIPCGRCLGCRLEYSRSWADRLMLEREYHSKACFITLTYSPDNVEHLQRIGVDDLTGEVVCNLTLSKRDFQLFMKRLRKQFGDGIRFYACGEYGDLGRPHFHAIIFGEDFSEDRYEYKKGPCGDVYYRSDMLERFWPYGFSMIGECSFESCAYTARYVTKKYKGQDAVFYEARNIEPPFSLMSRRPGIAAQYYEDHKAELVDPLVKRIVVSTEKGAHDIFMPKYYNAKLELDFPEEYAIIKEKNRAAAEEAMQAKLSRTDLDRFEYLENEERKRKKKFSALKRSVE